MIRKNGKATNKISFSYINFIKNSFTNSIRESKDWIACFVLSLSIYSYYFYLKAKYDLGL